MPDEIVHREVGAVGFGFYDEDEIRKISVKRVRKHPRVVIAVYCKSMTKFPLFQTHRLRAPMLSTISGRLFRRASWIPRWGPLTHEECKLPARKRSSFIFILE